MAQPLLARRPAGVFHAARAAENYAGKAVRRGEQRLPPPVFCLRPRPGFPVDDGLVAVLIIELRQNAIVAHLPFSDGIGSIGLLSAQVARVDLVLQDIRYGGFHEAPAGNRSQPLFMKSIADLPKRRAVQKQFEDLAHGLRLFGDDYILFQRVVIAVSEHMLVGHADHALLEALADAPFAVF